MQDWPDREHYTAEDLVQIIRILRDPETGCPWDKVQTHASIRKNFLEETCEALEAIDADDAAMDLAERGKTQAKIVSEQAKLAKAQRQLGALVYSLAKGNEENQPLVDKYIEMIDSIERELASLKEALGPAAVEITRDLEKEPVAADAAPTEEPAAETPAAAEDAPKACPQCGAPVSDDALFCNKCGAQL